MSILFYHLSILGYGIISREDNLWGVKGCCAEFTFLHVEHQHRHQRLLVGGGSRLHPFAAAAGATAPAGGSAVGSALGALHSLLGGDAAADLPAAAGSLHGAGGEVLSPGAVTTGNFGEGTEDLPRHKRRLRRRRSRTGGALVGGGAGGAGGAPDARGRRLLGGEVGRSGKWGGAAARWVAVGTWEDAE